MEESNKLIPSLSIWLLHFSINKILLAVESLITESQVKNCSLKDFLTLFTSQNQMNNDVPGKIYFSFIPNSDAKDVSARNCSQTTKEQANTISKVKLNKIGFRVLV